MVEFFCEIIFLGPLLPAMSELPLHMALSSTWNWIPGTFTRIPYNPFAYQPIMFPDLAPRRMSSKPFPWGKSVHWNQVFNPQTTCSYSDFTTYQKKRKYVWKGFQEEHPKSGRWGHYMLSEETDDRGGVCWRVRSMLRPYSESLVYDANGGLRLINDHFPERRWARMVRARYPWKYEPDWKSVDLSKRPWEFLERPWEVFELL